MGGLTIAFDLLVDPAQQGRLEAPLLEHLLSRFARRPFVTDHP